MCKGTDRLNDGEKSDFVVYNWALRVNMQCNDTELREKAANGWTGWLLIVIEDPNRMRQYL